MMGRLSPLIIKDELSHTVELEVHGTRRNHFSGALHHQMMRQPTGFIVDAARSLQAVQPMPLQERRAVDQQGIPLHLRDFRNLANSLDRDVGTHQGDSIMIASTGKISDNSK